MAETYTTLAARLNRTFPECDSTVALRLFNQVLRALCQDLPLYRNTSTVSLTADTQTYSLSDAIVQIEQCFYEESADNRVILDPTSIDELNQDDRLWRYVDSSTPRAYFLVQDTASTTQGGMLLGLYPTPDTSTSGTYPRLRLYTIVRPSSDVTGSDQSPDILERPDVLVWGAAYLYLEEMSEFEEAQRYYRMYIDEKGRQWKHITGRTNRYMKPRVQRQSYIRDRRVV